MEVTTEMASLLFPLFNFTLCTGVWTARFTAQGHEFPPTGFLSPKEKVDGAEMSRTMVIFPSWCFCVNKYRAGGSIQSSRDCLHGPRQQNVHSENPQFSEKVVWGVGKIQFQLGLQHCNNK